MDIEDERATADGGRLLEGFEMKSQKLDGMDVVFGRLTMNGRARIGRRRVLGLLCASGPGERAATERRRTAVEPRLTLKVVACVLLFTVPFAGASEVPFSGKNIIEADFSGSNSVVAADIDGDGDLDIVGAALVGDDIIWWENTAGDGSAWTEHTIDGKFDGAYAVRAADIDGDGDLDVVGAASRADSISWWENTAGDGSAWTEHNIEPDFNFAASVHVADVDGDGDLDLLGAAVFANDLAWWENTSGDGSAWTKQSIEFGFSGAASVFAADLDGDGDLDTLGTGDSGIAWWANTQGDGSAWGARQTINTVLTLSGPVSAFAADVDSDGDLDVFAAAQFSNEFAWWENTAGDGSAWTGHVLGLEFEGAISVVVADMDADGDLDVVGGALFDSNAITWWDNTAGDASVWAERTIDGGDGGASSVFVADVDSDGDLDVLGTGGFIDGVNWWENETIHRSATFPGVNTVESGFDRPLSIHSADMDGDGDLDLLGAAFDDGKLAWWANGGDGSFGSEQIVDASFGGALFVTTADLDGDGDLDVLGAANSSSAATNNDISWWENTAGDGSAWSPNAFENGFNAALSVQAADLDGDGDLDIVGASRNDNDVSWWENEATVSGPSFTERAIDINFDGASSVAVVDMDQDGDLDVVGAAQDADEIAWWENTAGDGTAWFQHNVASLFDGAIFVVIADVDADGDPDVVGAARDGNDISWFENTAGDGSAWAERSIDDNFDRPFSVYASDLDADGDIDVLGTAANANDVTWWENTAGDGTAWTPHTIDGDFAGARSVVAADLDGDGDADVVGAARDADEIAWWANRGGQFALPTSDVAPERVADGDTVAVLEIDATHRGRPGDPDIELATLELLLEDSTGTPLDSTQANALVESLSVYLDDGSGVFEIGTDSAVSTVDTLSLIDGVLIVPFTDGDPDVAVSFGTTRTYFVTVTFDAASAAAVPDELRVTHMTESSSTGEDADHDVPLALEYSSNTLSSLTEVNDLPIAVDDAVAGLEEAPIVGNVLDGSAGGLDSDEEGDAFSAVLISGPSSGSLTSGLAANGDFAYQPDPDFSGVDSFTYAANDGAGDGNPATVTITVDAVNDAPSFSLTPAASAAQDLSSQSFPGFASAISAGPANEAGQSLTFEFTKNSNPTLFTDGPALTGDGILTFTLASTDVGSSATLTVRLMDDGGTENGGVDVSPTQDFEILVIDSLPPEITALASSSNEVIEECAELRSAMTSLVVTFSEGMANPAGDIDPEDVTNPANYQLVGSGPDGDLTSLGCDALAEDDVLLTPIGVTYDAVSSEATATLSSTLDDGIYRLFVCGALEDVNGNSLLAETTATFRQSAESLFSNGNLDCDLNGWTTVSNLPEEIEWSAEDVNDAAVSGSVKITDLSGGPLTIGQCVNANPTLARPQVRIDGPANVEVSVVTICEGFDAPSCGGTSLGLQTRTNVVSQTAGTWQPLTAVLAAQGASSVLCGFDLTLVNGTDFEAYLDVLTLSDVLFEDGFESGNTSAWSLVVP